MEILPYFMTAKIAKMIFLANLRYKNMETYIVSFFYKQILKLEAFAVFDKWT
jgi:hypothetical protein